MKTWGQTVKPDPRIDAVSARRALRDAYVAQRDLEKAIREEQHQRTRMTWITAVTLLRAVGHVLDKVDGVRSPWIKLASDQEFARCKDDKFGNVIFWQLIHDERNHLLKEYKASISTRATVLTARWLLPTF